MREPAFTSLPWKQLVGVFALCVGLYFAIFFGVEWSRHQKGGWQITFGTDARGEPMLVIEQPRLKIENVRMLFVGAHLAETGVSKKVEFQTSANLPPFGVFKHKDLLYLPGDLTFDFFGHQVEIMPRTLIIDSVEHPWHSGEKIVIH